MNFDKDTLFDNIERQIKKLVSDWEKKKSAALQFNSEATTKLSK